MIKIFNSIIPIINNSTHVTINESFIDFFCTNNQLPNEVNWLNNCPFNIKSLTYYDQITFAIVLNTISFCFWNKPKWSIKYNGLNYDGSWGIISALALNIAKNDKTDSILSFDYLSNMTLEKFNSIVNDESNLLDLKTERIEAIREIALFIRTELNGNIDKLFEVCNYDCLQLVDLITLKLKSFSDLTFYNDLPVYFYKRAQLLVSDLSSIYFSKFNKYLNNHDQLTACADYKIPYILREFNILNYSQELTNLIDNRAILPKDSIYEIEIRANALWAVDLIKRKYQDLSLNYLTTTINDYLWLISQIKNPNYRPYHLTRTINY